ncbi:nuclear transport factor 2 family protein [Tamlana sp. 62-3]|uniref:Nuclear transport factor 2 family protein n=1 Tax=Neotamlana sargassicola TaxID=2883125 RepID=A0A9X1I7B1_9FLAO|nr:nuclear transport factor 2 family protein [Tamlana sargassicola]MCB4809160.1 nuclear transport factor 2 family protein [Tamlana sargassicola]
MKKLSLLFVFAILSIQLSVAQKKSNGTVYIDHPAIKIVEEMTEAFVKGDTAKVASYLADDFKSYNGLDTSTNPEGQNKESFLKSVLFWHNSLDYFTVTRTEGAYPDAIEYKKNNDKDVVWVQTWEDIRGIHKKTGVKIDMFSHRLLVVNKDNKIQTEIAYFNESVFDEIGDSFVNRTNGTIYNHHDNINTVRKMVYAFEKQDFDKSLSYFTDDARFYDINAPYDKWFTKAETKTNWENFLKKFTIVGIDIVGYPDYLEYEMGEGRDVLSWWKFNLIRKSDDKKIELLMHLNNRFDADGKITSMSEYYSSALLYAK